jgi:hypothetical protein
MMNQSQTPAADFVAACLAAVREDGRFISSADAKRLGCDPTSRRAFGATPTAEDRAEAIRRANECFGRDARSEFDVSLREAASRVLSGGTLNNGFARGVAAVLARPVASAKPAGRVAEAFAKIAEMFRTALTPKSGKAPKRNPRILFDGATPVALSYSIQKGRIWVTDGRPYGQSRYYGSLDAQTGEFRASGACTPEVVGVLTNLNADPANYAAEYGKRTGACCFCATRITTDESLEVGYGPICAARYGLPWG